MEKKINRNKEFIKNTIILFVGKFATQFMSILLLPLFTHYLLTDDYGLVDLMQTYISLFVPVLTLRIDSAVFRFLIDNRDNEKEANCIISNIMIILLCGILLVVGIGIIINIVFEIKYFIYVILNIIVLMISNVLLQVLRGLGKNTKYSITSIITGLSTLIINIVLIVNFHFGADSILISSTIANIICIVFMAISLKITKKININFINKKYIKEILSYSIPMIPNSLSWWIVNVSDRSLISIFLGVTYNGIYTISCKFSNILNSIYSIINMSWQETASLHIEDDDKDIFFTEMINKIFFGFSNISLIIIGCLPFVFNFIIGNNYLESYKYIPILLYANSWNVLIGLIGGIYVAKKKTREIANTTIISAIINIVINLLLIKFIGLYAACISTLLSYIIMCFYRCLDCKKYVKFKLNIVKLFIYTVIFMISSLLYYINSTVLNFVNLVIIIIYIFIENINFFKYLMLKEKSGKI